MWLPFVVGSLPFSSGTPVITLKKKLHKGVFDYSTDRPLTQLRLNQARWLLGDFPATVTPSKLCAYFKFNVNNLFIIFFILLVIYSVWQNNKIKKSI